jgi:hypothetical protein
VPVDSAGTVRSGQAEPGFKLTAARLARMVQSGERGRPRRFNCQGPGTGHGHVEAGVDSEGCMPVSMSERLPVNIRAIACKNIRAIACL